MWNSLNSIISFKFSCTFTRRKDQNTSYFFFYQFEYFSHINQHLTQLIQSSCSLIDLRLESNIRIQSVFDANFKSISKITSCYLKSQVFLILCLNRHKTWLSFLFPFINRSTIQFQIWFWIIKKQPQFNFWIRVSI